jgi:hypothetical protein
MNTDALEKLTTRWMWIENVLGSWSFQGIPPLIQASLELAQFRNRIKELEARTTWQPIETAPDETEILILDDEVYQAHWDKEELLWYCEGADMYLLPTHWMPLPEPPK